MGWREQRERTTPRSEVTLGSCGNQAQDDSLRGAQCADILGNTAVRSIATACVLRHVPAQQRWEKSRADVHRYHTCAPALYDATTSVGGLPAEDPQSKKEGVCCLLLRSIYGLRDAGMNFEMLTRQVMDKLDFNCGLWTHCVFVHREKDMQAYVYGDNFVIKGVRRELYDFFEHLKFHMWAKSEGVLGPDRGQGDVREVVCLSRVFRWCLPTSGRPEAIDIEANARHVEILAHQLNFQNAKTLATPGVKSTSSDVGHTLPLEIRTAFPSMCMRANYLAADRDDVWFVCREIARLMSEPCEVGWEKLKRLGRYLAGVPYLVQRMERQDPPSCVLVEWFRCLRNEKIDDMQTSWCMAITSWRWFAPRKYQLHSALAKASVTAHAGCAVIGLKNLCRDLGRDLAAHMAGDASAASGIGATRGVGKIRHLETLTLWLQKHVTEKEIVLRRRKGLREPERPWNETPWPSDDVEARCGIGFRETWWQVRAEFESYAVAWACSKRGWLCLLTSCGFMFADIRCRLRMDAQSVDPGFGMMPEWRWDRSWNVLAHVLEGRSEKPSCRPLLLCVCTQSLLQIFPCGTHWPHRHDLLPSQAQARKDTIRNIVQ